MSACFLISACNENADPDIQPVIPQCGNGLLEAGEYCDGMQGVPSSCVSWDGTREWETGGMPACSADCLTVTIGSCVEKTHKVDDPVETRPVCGNGRIENGEVCDKTAGVPSSCTAWDNAKKWGGGGVPACSDDCTQIVAGTCVEELDEVTCGNGIREEGEVCDGMDGVPESCSAWDDSVTWLSGAPECAQDCSGVTAGSCIEEKCGNGKLDEGEVCDGELGVPESCSELKKDTDWASDGRPACNKICTGITTGTCRPLRSFTFVSWNVQVDYESWGGKPVAPRAAKLKELVSEWITRWTQMPAVIAIVEVSPIWHSSETTQIFNDLGYEWADVNVPIKDKWNNFECGENNENVSFEPTGLEDANAASCFLFTSMLYQKEKYDLIDADYVKLEPDRVASPFVNNKVTAFCAVVQSKDDGQKFITCSTHWEANNGVKTADGIPGILGPIVKNEMTRIAGAEIAAEFVLSMKNKYPDAHIVFGGDFNTIDLSIIYKNPIASVILGDDDESLRSLINELIGENSGYDLIPEGFKGSLSTFGENSKLHNARTMAKQQELNIEDIATTSDPGIPEFVVSLGIPVVIDYNFYSDSLVLRDYKVVNGEDYKGVSDHYPIKTIYGY